MPSYDFRCNQCNHAFTVTTSWTKKAEVTCPACGSHDLKELFGNYRFSATSKSDGGACASPSGFG